MKWLIFIHRTKADFSFFEVSASHSEDDEPQFTSKFISNFSDKFYWLRIFRPNLQFRRLRTFTTW